MIIRDPVHGDIELTQELVELLDTPEVQRLRGVKQLGTASLVYPGTLHTRFDHSLGTLHMAGRILERLARRGARLEPDAARVVMAAALLHDVSHVPFGHTFEDERRVLPRHDTPERLRRALGQGRLGERLDRLGLQEGVTALLARGDRSGGRRDPKVPGWSRDLVAGTVDADLLDYLLRDAHFTGLVQRYDARVLDLFGLEGDQLVLELSEHGVERPDAFSEILHVLRMRYVLTERVYLHHAKVAAGAMVSKALERVLKRGWDPRQLEQFTDELFLERLEQAGRDGGDAGSVRLVQGLRRRELLKRAYVLDLDAVGPDGRDRLVEAYHRCAAAREAVEARLADALGVPDDQVILYVPAPSYLNEATVPVRTSEGLHPLTRLPEPLQRRWGMASLQAQYEGLWKLYLFVPAGTQPRARALAEATFGYPTRWWKDPGPKA
ncbi:HD domain-containing protein [Limnochorda pilosa]|uniref:Phosphohydrolase n=1 Tax=Limnochorda pilosa TaxID=1555112 RepID=A0A0K2SQE5_LIMPI|nr:HD domain-containing protein [Limnochorda pilosa]BAS29345.1 phosphohydrolase [Limnochorda pilosa]